jgi:fused signal recognition particle receptor
VATATRIVDDLREQVRERKIKDPSEIMALLNEELVSLFDTEKPRDLTYSDDRPTVWLIVGVNGTGKTTTIGKLASTLSRDGKSVALAAADTFRAAADEQLGAWGERSGAQLVKHQPGADPGAVAFDAYKFAKARELDVLLVDTAGRLHTKTPPRFAGSSRRRGPFRSPCSSSTPPAGRTASTRRRSSPGPRE